MKQRIITGVIAGGLFIGALVAGGYVFATMITLIAVIAFYEVFDMTDQKKRWIYPYLLILYIALGFYSLIQMRIEEGFAYILLIVGSIWATDSGAYFTGKQFGKHKLAPTISPNKTIEGAVGGIVSAVIFASVFHWVHPVMESYLLLFGVIVLVSIGGQVGDLFQSKIKRYYGVKDSGNSLPGHGGMFDRFDSMILVFALLWLVNLI